MPVGITGTEKLFPIAEDSLKPGPIRVRVGRPCPADAVRRRAQRNRQLIMDSIGFAIAALVPPEYRGVYQDDGLPDAGDARRIASEVLL